MPDNLAKDTPKALPATGETSTSRPAKAPATEALTIEQACERYGLSSSTIYRRLHRAEVPAAYKVLGPQGESWRIPLGSMEAIGYAPQTGAAEPDPEPTGSPALESVLAQLTGLLDQQQLQLQAAQGDRDVAARAAPEQAIANARLEAQLEAANANLEDVKAQLEQAGKRRRWFSRDSSP